MSSRRDVPGGAGSGFSKDAASAAPFVPAASPAASAATFKVTAAPFVPGSAGGSSGSVTSAGSSKQQAAAGSSGSGKAGSASQLLTSHAQPFVPASQKAAAGAGTPGSSQGSSSLTAAGGGATPPHFSRQGHGAAAGSPHRGRAGGSNSSNNMLASPPAGPATTPSPSIMLSAAQGSTPTSGQPYAGAAGGFSAGAGQHAASPLSGRGGGRGPRGEGAPFGSGQRGRGRPAPFIPAHSHTHTDSTPAGVYSAVPMSAHHMSSPGGAQPHGVAHAGRGGPLGPPPGLAHPHSHNHVMGRAMMGVGRAAGYGHPHAKPQPPGRANLQARQFMDEGLRQQLAAAAYTVQAQWAGSREQAAAGGALLPERISHYHTLLPLDTPLPASTGSTPSSGVAALGEAYSPALGVRTLVIKGISSHDGQPYALRRIDGKQVIPTPDVLSCAMQAVDAWAPLAHHPQLVALRSAFVSSELDATAALLMVYDFHPGCVTLAALHLAPSLGAGGCVSVVPPTEAQLWSYLVQLTSLLHAVHGCGLALKPSCLHASKVLVTPSGRLRVNCCGLVGVVSGEHAGGLMEGSTGSGREELAAAHRADLTALGQLLLALACVGLVPPGHAGSMEVLSSPAGVARVRPELARLIAALLAASEGGPLGSVRQLAAYPALVEHTLGQLDASSAHVDALMSELAKECENGRLLRLLIKLSFVVERPASDVDGSWAETGDRYLLKLFRDFVFHQVVPEGSTGAGGPLLDWGHVVEALNKLDAGVPERVMLLARDEAAMLIASYADLKRCVEHSYSDLHSQIAHSKV